MFRRALVHRPGMAMPAILPSVATSLPAAAAIGLAGLTPSAIVARAEDCIAAGAFKAALDYLELAKLRHEGRALPSSTIANYSMMNTKKALAASAHPCVDYLRALCFLRLKDTLSARAALREEVDNFPLNEDAVDLLGRVNSSLQHSFVLPQLIVDSEPLFAAFYKSLALSAGEASPSSSSSPLSLSWPRLFSLYSHARELCEAGIEGDFVECGSASTSSDAVPSAVLLAIAANAFGGGRRRVIHCSAMASDSPQSNANMNRLAAAFGVEVVKVSGPLEEVLPKLVSAEGAHGITVSDVALLHADCEWYGSTKAAMSALYPRVARGGIVQIDDYNYWDGCRQAVAEELCSHGLSPRSVLHAVDANAVWMRKEE